MVLFDISISRVFKSRHKHIYSLHKLATTYKFGFLGGFFGRDGLSTCEPGGKWGVETDNSEDLTNAEVFTSVFDLLDVVLAENKKLL